jgi:hypothetical protein
MKLKNENWQAIRKKSAIFCGLLASFHFSASLAFGVEKMICRAISVDRPAFQREMRCVWLTSR